MGTNSVLEPPILAGSPNVSRLLQQYGCGPVQFEGNENALYEHHLLFDNAIATDAATPRDRFEAFARSVRDILSQRWVLTERTYEHLNPKRVYYLSMEFLIGRSLTNNINNLLLGELAQHAIQHKHLDWIDMLEQEPDAALGNGGLGRLAACFIESAATLQLPAMGYGLRYDYGLFKQGIRDGWQCEQPDNWCGLTKKWKFA
jgi:starch phosphorylase